MENDSYFNILCLDGGGIKGLYSARVLQHFEEQFDTPAGKCFDLICGTSTGGLISLALALGRSAKDTGDFYSEKGIEIFPYVARLSRRYHSLKSYLFKSKYKSGALKKSIASFLGEDTQMSDLKTNVCIPAYNISTGSRVIFKRSSNPMFYIDRDVKVVDVALATSAAPTYFPIHEICGTASRNGHYIDGGIWANDPSTVGLLEALKYLDPEGLHKIRILSISAVPTSAAIPIMRRKRYSALNWGSKIFDAVIQAQGQYNSILIRWLCERLQCEYIRITPENLSPAQCELLEMDFASPQAIDLYNTIGQESAIYAIRDHYTLLKSIFNTK